MKELTWVNSIFSTVYILMIINNFCFCVFRGGLSIFILCNQAETNIFMFKVQQDQVIFVFESSSFLERKGAKMCISR